MQKWIEKDNNAFLIEASPFQIVSAVGMPAR